MEVYGNTIKKNQYYKEDPKYKQKITGQTGNDRTKDVQIKLPLKYLSNFWRTFEMPLNNCEINIF